MCFKILVMIIVLILAASAHQMLWARLHHLVRPFSQSFSTSFLPYNDSEIKGRVTRIRCMRYASCGHAKSSASLQYCHPKSQSQGVIVSLVLSTLARIPSLASTSTSVVWIPSLVSLPGDFLFCFRS